MTRVNVVPRDFIVDAVGYLSGRSVSEGRTYQLADPRALTVDEMAETLAHATGRELVKVPLPRKLAKVSLARIPGLRRLMRIPPEAVDYFSHPTTYLTDHCRADLAGSGIEPPSFLSYVDRLVGTCAAIPKSAPQRCSEADERGRRDVALTFGESTSESPERRTMNDLLKNIEQRHSPRVPFDHGRATAKEDLLQILEAAR
jgi:hypothetical protein